MSSFKLFQRVFLHGCYRDSQRTGNIVGFGTIASNREIRSTVIVELDQGYYSEDKKTWTSHVVVDESNLEVIPSDNG